MKSNARLSLRQQTRERKNHAASILTPRLPKEANRSDELPSVHRILDGVEVEREFPG